MGYSRKNLGRYGQQFSAPSVTSYTYPASVGGINAQDSLMLMKPEDCLFTFNLMPSEYGSRLRKGYTEWSINCATDVNKNNDVRTIISFDSNTLSDEFNRLFAVTSEGIWDVSLYGNAAPANVMPFTDNQGDAGFGVWCEYTGDAADSTNLLRGHYLYYADARNGLFVYTELTDTWAQVTNWTYQTGTTTGTPPEPILSPYPVEDIAFIMVYKRALWVILQNDDDAWYLPSGNIAGELKRFTFGSKMPHGGNLQGLYNWSVDAGIGIDDMLVAIGRGGDVIVYNGIDPNGSEFTSRGVWFIGETPKSRRIAIEYGPDLYMLSSYGIVSLNNLLKGDPVDRPAISAKVARFLRADIASGRDSSAWQLVLNPGDGFMQVITPRPASTPYLQYNLNTQTGAWGFWEKVPMIGASSWQGDYFFGGPDGKVYLYDGVLDGTTLFNENLFQNSPILPVSPEWSVPAPLEFRCDGSQQGSFLPYATEDNGVRNNSNFIMQFDGKSELNARNELVQVSDALGNLLEFTSGNGPESGFKCSFFTLQKTNTNISIAPIMRISRESYVNPDSSRPTQVPTLPASVFTELSTQGFTIQLEINKSFFEQNYGQTITPTSEYLTTKILSINYDSAGVDKYFSICRPQTIAIGQGVTALTMREGTTPIASTDTEFLSSQRQIQTIVQNDSYDDFVLVHIDFDPSVNKCRLFADKQLITVWDLDVKDGIKWFDFGTSFEGSIGTTEFLQSTASLSNIRNVQLLKKPINLSATTPKRIAIIGDSLMQQFQYNTYTSTDAFYETGNQLALSGIINTNLPAPPSDDQLNTLPLDLYNQQSGLGWVQSYLVERGIYANATNIQGQGSITERIETYARGGSTCITNLLLIPDYDLKSRIDAMLNVDGGGGGPEGGSLTPVYDIVMIQIGTNDLQYFASNPTADRSSFITIYEQQIDRLILAGVKEIIIGNIPRLYVGGGPASGDNQEVAPLINLELNESIVSLNGYRNVVTVVDMYTAMNSNFYRDQAHFTAQGQKKQAKIFTEAVNKSITQYKTTLISPGIESGKKYTVSYKIKDAPINSGAGHLVSNELGNITQFVSGNTVVSVQIVASLGFLELNLVGQYDFIGTFYNLFVAESGVLGEPIDFRALTSYQAPQGHSNFSRVGLVRTIGLLAGTANIEVKAIYDYQIQNILLDTEVVGFKDLNLWDSAIWDQSTWDFNLRGETFISGSLGIGRSFAISIAGNSDTRLNIVGYDVMFNVGGYL